MFGFVKNRLKPGISFSIPALSLTSLSTSFSTSQGQPATHGTEMVMPGDTTEMTVELIQPIAMEEGLGFAIREGGRTVGSGRVTKIIK